MEQPTMVTIDRSLGQVSLYCKLNVTYLIYSIHNFTKSYTGICTTTTRTCRNYLALNINIHTYLSE